jgi:hypothetical protein
MKTLLSILITFTYLTAQYQVGDVVSDFSAPFCDNDDGNGEFALSNYPGSVIWINLFTSW